MPITREPSQRALGWVRWNSNKGTNSGSDSKRAEPEIVHLGGVHVGTATDLLGLPPAPGRSTPTDRPPAQWAVNPLASNPPGNPFPSPRPNNSSNGTLGIPMGPDEDRPLTQWFPTWQEDIAEDRDESRDPASSQRGAGPNGNSGPNLSPNSHLTPNSHMTPTIHLTPNSNLMPSANVTPNSNPNANSAPEADIEERRQPISTARTPPPHIITQYTSEIVSSPTLTSRSPADITDQNHPRPTKFPQRSTSLSQASRHAPPRLAKRPIQAAHSLTAQEINLRRTQSHAEVQRSAGWRGAPPRIDTPDGEEHFQHHQQPQVVREPSPRAHEPQRSPRGMAAVAEARIVAVAPSSRTASSSGPVTPVDRAAAREHSQTRAVFILSEESGSLQMSPAASDAAEYRGEETRSRQRQRSRPRQQAAPPVVAVAKPRQQQQNKLTAKERYWMHKHYRGEAGFLKAWGLDIASEEDRVEGVEIVREIMEAEAREEGGGGGGAGSERRAPSRSRSLSDSGSAASSSSPVHESVGLGVIEEERNSRDFHPRSMTRSPVLMDGSGDNNRPLLILTDSRDRKYHSGSETHSRNESNESVLGEYLDLRLDLDR